MTNNIYYFNWKYIVLNNWDYHYHLYNDVTFFLIVVGDDVMNMTLVIQHIFN